MNQIEIKKIHKSKNWIDFEWFIDGMRLSKYMAENKTITLPDNVEPFDTLCPAWTKGLDFYGDVRFVWDLLEREKTILPIYMCPDDLDFSCIVIVVEVEKMKDYVYWNRIGLVNKKNYSFEEEKQHGILDLKAYSDDDWEYYGDNIALADVNSEEWLEWINSNWEEELFRRRKNYTISNFNENGNVLWFIESYWTFDRIQYEKMVKCVWEQETLADLVDGVKSEMKFDDCVTMIKKLNINGCDELFKHKKIFGDILLHVYASEQIGQLLYDLLLKESDSIYVNIYTTAIEKMWRYGDESVKNIVDVTLLEYLSDNEKVWNLLGKFISKDFKEYINNELLRSNIAMCGIFSI